MKFLYEIIFYYLSLYLSIYLSNNASYNLGHTGMFKATRSFGSLVNGHRSNYYKVEALLEIYLYDFLFYILVFSALFPTFGLIFKTFRQAKFNAIFRHLVSCATK